MLSTSLSTLFWRAAVGLVVSLASLWMIVPEAYAKILYAGVNEVRRPPSQPENWCWHLYTLTDFYIVRRRIRCIWCEGSRSSWSVRCRF